MLPMSAMHNDPKHEYDAVNEIICLETEAAALEAETASKGGTPLVISLSGPEAAT